MHVAGCESHIPRISCCMNSNEYASPHFGWLTSQGSKSAGWRERINKKSGWNLTSSHVNFTCKPFESYLMERTAWWCLQEMNNVKRNCNTMLHIQAIRTFFCDKELRGDAYRKWIMWKIISRAVIALDGTVRAVIQSRTSRRTTIWAEKSGQPRTKERLVEGRSSARPDGRSDEGVLCCLLFLACWGQNSG